VTGYALCRTHLDAQVLQVFAGAAADQYEGARSGAISPSNGCRRLVSGSRHFDTQAGMLLFEVGDDTRKHGQQTL
jgi:hypothetical protein